ncbi:hypothetical protein Trydic_g7384 [Trypoxylus dichotomus]
MQVVPLAEFFMMTFSFIHIKWQSHNFPNVYRVHDKRHVRRSFRIFLLTQLCGLVMRHISTSEAVLRNKICVVEAVPMSRKFMRGLFVRMGSEFGLRHQE